MADVLYLFFKKDDCEVMHVRYESLNMHIFFQTIFSKGILNIKNNYKFNYIKTVSPKVVITCIDNNAAFYKLKDIYDKTTYISVQLSTRDNKFINECNNYYSNTKGKKLKSDHIFVLGKKYMEIFSKIIDSKIHLLGSFKNNYFYLKKNNNFNKEKSILFISQIYPTSPLNKIKREIKIFNSLYEYCSKKNYVLNLCSKNSPSVESFYRKKLTKGKWNYFPTINPSSSYEIVNNSKLIVFTNSTLGLEALIKKIRCISFPPEDFPIKNFMKKYSDKGPFWSCTFDYETMVEYLERVINYSEEEWDRIIKEHIGDIIEYDPKNSRFYEIVKKINLPIKNQSIANF